jgi:hypothetical protein
MVTLTTSNPVCVYKILRIYGLADNLLASQAGRNTVEFVKEALRSKSKKKKNPWSESASELDRPSDRRLSAK